MRPMGEKCIQENYISNDDEILGIRSGNWTRLYDFNTSALLAG